MKPIPLGHGTYVIARDHALRLVDIGKPVCHGYQNGCVCPPCLGRAKPEGLKAKAQPAQPWEPKAA